MAESGKPTLIRPLRSVKTAQTTPANCSATCDYANDKYCPSPASAFHSLSLTTTHFSPLR